MSSNKYRFAQIVLLALVTCWNGSTHAGTVCPERPGQSLRQVTVFDGTPEELASLVPDEDGRRKGYWLLGGVYDTGRSVSIRCEYADGQTRDVVLGQRVERCSYRIDATKTMSLDCR